MYEYIYIYIKYTYEYNKLYSMQKMKMNKI